jgi:hypothetical protein
LIKLSSKGNNKLGEGCEGHACFSLDLCTNCPLRDRCIKKNAKSGRSITINEYEKYHQLQRNRIKTPEGREKLRERVSI